MNIAFKEDIMQQDSLDIFDDMIPKREPSKKNDSKSPDEFTQQEIRTAYLLSNALLQLLLDKGIIQQSEVDQLIEEMYEEYKKLRGK
jgi:hypothetical protein